MDGRAELGWALFCAFRGTRAIAFEGGSKARHVIGPITTLVFHDG